LSPGIRVGGARYILKRLLGRGEFSEVWLAQDVKSSREVALKFLPQVFLSDANLLERLKQETRRIFLLTHPHIAATYEFARDYSLAAIVTEFVDGWSLATLKVDKLCGCYGVGEIEPWVSQLCAALDYAHSEFGIVHSDLKPANLLLNAQAELKITDFGIAQTVRIESSRRGLAKGVSSGIGFLSPQQVMGGEPSKADDIYSLGATIFDLLTGTPPFHKGEIIAQICSLKPETMTERLDELGIQADPIPPVWEDTVARCLAKNPAERPQSAGETLQLLRRLEVVNPVESQKAKIEKKAEAPIEIKTPEAEKNNPAEEISPIIGPTPEISSRPKPKMLALIAAGVLFAILIIAAGIFSVSHLKRSVPGAVAHLAGSTNSLVVAMQSGTPKPAEESFNTRTNAPGTLDNNFSAGTGADNDIFALLPAYQTQSVKSLASSDIFSPPDFSLPTFPDKTYNVKDFGATGGGTVNDTPAIDKAIAKCNAGGGGTVTFPAGRYAAGSIHLMSNVRLLLDTNAVIFGLAGAFEPAEPNAFDKYQDFGHSHFHDALLYGENVANVAIIGGKIDGGSIVTGTPKDGNGDKLICIKIGRNLDFENITHEKGAHFCYLLNDCVGVTFNGIVIKQSRDAVDLMGCSDVQIHNCHFTGCGDDTIGVKSDYALGRRVNSANIYVWDSYFESGCNGLQFGSETAGNFTNCNFWNIAIGRAGKAGIGITSGDSAIVDGVNYSNIVIKGASCPIYMLVWNRMRTGEPGVKTGTIKNVHVENVTITDCPAGGVATQPSVISGWPTSSFENITFENLKIVYKGGDTDALTNLVPPYPKGAGDYSPRNLGPRPASAFYIRNGKGLTFKNVQFSFETPDARTPLVLDNVSGVTLDNFTTQKSSGGQSLRLEKVTDLTVENSPGLKSENSTTVKQGGE